MCKQVYLVLVKGMPGIPVLQLNKDFIKMVLDSQGFSPHIFMLSKQVIIWVV